MKITLATNDGELLDSVVLSADEFRAEVDNHPHGILAQLSPGDLEAIAEEER